MNIYEKLSAVQTELKAPKNQYNSFGKYNYRSLEDINESVKPLLKKYRLSLTVSDSPIIIGDRIYIETTATLIDVEKPSERVINKASARESLTKKGMDDSQITGATSSYARKYCLNGLFCLDDTKDADSMDNTKKENNAKTPQDNNKFIKKMKELATQSPEAYWYVMKFWELTSASQITNPESQEKIIEEIINKIAESNIQKGAA